MAAVTLEREDEEETETPTPNADADADPEVNEVSSNEVSSNEVSSNEDTVVDQAHIQQTLIELQNLGTLDQRDSAWLSALLKGGASAAQQRRSDADVFEYAQQCIASMTKSKGKPPALTAVERQVSIQFTLSNQHKTHIRKMLNGGKGHIYILVTYQVSP